MFNETFKPERKWEFIRVLWILSMFLLSHCIVDLSSRFIQKQLEIMLSAPAIKNQLTIFLKCIFNCIVQFLEFQINEVCCLDLWVAHLHTVQLITFCAWRQHGFWKGLVVDHPKLVIMMIQETSPTSTLAPSRVQDAREWVLVQQRRHRQPSW
jgi:hypothetical protein